METKKQSISDDELEKVVKAYNKDKPISEKRVTITLRTVKYLTAGLLLTGAFAARQFLSIGRA